MGGAAVLPVVRRAHGAAESGAGAVLPYAAHRVFRRHRQRAWDRRRAADSLALRSFLGVGLNEMPPDHSTISRTRRLIGVAVRFIPKFAHTVTSAKSSVYSLGRA